MRKQEKGAVSLEYILITALIAIALIVGWAYLQTQAEMNQKALIEVAARSASSSAFDAARAAKIAGMMPPVDVNETKKWSSRRVGGAQMKTFKFSQGGGNMPAADYDTAGVDWNKRSTAEGGPF